MASRLCSHCQKIPFDPDLKKLTAPNYSGPREWCLGTFGEVRHRTCPFCKLVVSIYGQNRASWTSGELPEDSRPVDVYFVSGSGFRILESPRGSFICIAVDPMDSKGWGQSGGLQVREVFNQWVDFDDVNRWISTCEHDHGPKCALQTYNPVILPRNTKRQLDFRLIDVQDMCIVYAPRHCRYIALSYVWGKASDGRLILNHDNEDSLMQPKALSDAQPPIPNTILDAMAVVRKLEERYLWVDSLCLLQDDVDELQDCTAIMDLFYEMAIFTIIAGSGSSAHAGLPGVSSRPRKVSRFVREVVPGLRMTTRVDVDTVLRRSFYSMRAWTMQEEVLSNRLLIFVNDQIYFRCPHGLYSEELNWRGKTLIDSSGGGSNNDSLYRHIFSKHDATFTEFSIMISYYTLRKLTYPWDILQAMQGMLRKYSIFSGVHCFEGMPPPFEQSFMFEKLDNVSTTMFNRREGFPSYSWTGWKHPIRWQMEILNATVANDLEEPYLGTWITWYCKLDDDKIYRINHSGRLRRAHHPPAPEQLRLTSSPAFQQIPISVSDTDFGLVHVGEYPLLLFWTICVNLKLAKSDAGWDVRDKNHERCGEVYLNSEILTTTREGKFAILAETKGGFWALLLRWKDEIAERCGMARLYPNVLENSLPPGPRWKSIVLG